MCLRNDDDGDNDGDDDGDDDILFLGQEPERLWRNYNLRLKCVH